MEIFETPSVRNLHSFILVDCFTKKYNLDDVVSLVKLVLRLLDFQECRTALTSGFHKDNVCEKEARGEEGINEGFYQGKMEALFKWVLRDDVNLVRTTQTTSPDSVWKRNNKNYIFEYLANCSFNGSKDHRTQLGHFKTIQDRKYQANYATPKENTWIFHFIGYNSLPDTIKEIETLTQYPSPDQCNIANWMYILHDHDWTKMYIVYRLLNGEQKIEQMFRDPEYITETTSRDVDSDEVKREGESIETETVPETDNDEECEPGTDAGLERDTAKFTTSDTTLESTKPKRSRDESKSQESVITATIPNPKKIKQDNKETKK
jgi:hypothetical protein